LVKPCKAVATWENFDQGTYLCGYRDVWKRSIEEAPLGQRAWVVQERFLAPRVLHFFAADQLFWGCGESQTCEAHPQAIQTNINSRLNCRDGSKLRNQAFLATNFAELRMRIGWMQYLAPTVFGTHWLESTHDHPSLWRLTSFPRHLVLRRKFSLLLMMNMWQVFGNGISFIIFSGLPFNRHLRNGPKAISHHLGLGPQ
jgi:hypothetical protein